MNQMIVNQEKLNNMNQYLTKGLASMKSILPEHMDPETLKRYALNASQNNPTLFLCTPQSVGLALMNAAALGLEPDGRNGHLVPYNQWNPKISKKEWVCQFIPDYKGYVKLMHQNQNLHSISAAAVREHDEFDFEFGTNSFIRHKPPLVGPRGNLIAAWAMYKLKDGSSEFVVLTQDEVQKHKAASPSSGKESSPWNKWEDSMWAKSAVRILQKFAPLGPAVESVAQYEEQVDLRELPGNRIFNRTEDLPPLIFDNGPDDYQGETIDAESTPSKSQDLAKKMKQNHSQPTTTAPPEQDLNQPHYRNENELNKALKAATAAGNGEAINAIIGDAKDSLDAGVIDDGIFNWINEQASIALEQLAAT